jgi:hypothetical protein
LGVIFFNYGINRRIVENNVSHFTELIYATKDENTIEGIAIKKEIEDFCKLIIENLAPVSKKK